MITKQVKVRSKFYTILWLIGHGFIPKRYFWIKKLPSFLYTSHLFFSYDKFNLCGKTFKGYNYSEKESWDVNEVWSFPKGLLKINDKEYSV